ncbi:MAG TPA: helix-turn-helix transcriptional regulator [Fastidiosipila sp.]|nr:helix-turn-helix transcriptional regulator [Fastidiosipila sp.]
MKPVTAQEMVEFLHKERDAIEATRKRVAERAEAESQRHAAEPLIRNDYLCRLVQGTTQEKDHLEGGVHIAGFKRAAVALLRIDHFQETAARLDMSWDLLLFAVMNVLQELAEPYDGCYVFLLPDADCGILAVTDSESYLPDQLVSLLRDVVRTLRDALGISVSTGMGDLVSSFASIPHSYELAKAALEASAEAERAVPPIVERAIRFIDQRYGDSGLSLLEMTRHLAVSVSHFTTLFKEHTGKTFVEYLTHVRIEKAKQRLINTDLMLYRIASDVGYDNPTYFASTFKKHVGITPKQFRKLHVRKD